MTVCYSWISTMTSCQALQLKQVECNSFFILYAVIFSAHQAWKEPSSIFWTKTRNLIPSLCSCRAAKNVSNIIPHYQRRIFIFGALGSFKLGALLEGMSHTLALHVLVTFTEQVVPIHKHITLFSIPSISGTKTVTITLTKRQRWSYMTTLHYKFVEYLTGLV